MSVTRAWTRAAVICVLAALAVHAGGHAGPRGSDEQWQRELEALDPQRPLAYFELAEQVEDAAVDEATRALARRLYALAGLLDARLSRSAALALAAMETEPQAKRRLLAVAVLLGERSGTVTAWDQRPERADTATGAALAALTDAFSYYRRGYGNKAVAALDKEPGTRELLQRNDRLIVGGAKRFLEDCRLYRGGQMRPSLHGDEIARMLRVELALLAGDERSFGSDLLLGRGQPLVEVDPDRLEEAFGFDAALPYHRDGRWVGEL